METVNRADSLDIQTDFTISVQETANRTDSLSTVTTFLKTIQDTVSRVDSISITTTFSVTVQETVNRVEKWIGNFWTQVNRITGTSWSEDDRNPPSAEL
jgi:archaellum biogenesis ATPase FlaH